MNQKGDSLVIDEVVRNKVATFIGFAKKAGKLSYGMDACQKSCVQGRAEIIIIANDFSGNSRQKIEEIADRSKVATLSYETKQKLGELLGQRDVGVLSVEEANLANGIKKAVGLSY